MFKFINLKIFALKLIEIEILNNFDFDNKK